MHGRIFYMITDNEKHEAEASCPFEDYDMANWIPGCDYAIQEDENEMMDSIDWLAEAYGIHIKKEKINIDGKEIIAGKIPEKEVKKIKTKLEGKKQEKIKELRNELQRKDPSIQELRIIVNDSTFYFVIAQSFNDEMDFLKYLNVPYGYHGGNLYILETFDYHV